MITRNRQGKATNEQMKKQNRTNYIINKKVTENRREENLRGALDRKEQTTEKNNLDKQELTRVEKLLQDNQISRGVDLIRGINLFN